jgi:predicted DNA-binding WGR domain protein
VQDLPALGSALNKLKREFGLTPTDEVKWNGMSAVILYRIDSARHMHRYYRMDVQLDLFGAWCLVREWGRIGSAGLVRSIPDRTLGEAEAALERHRGAKERRSYCE